MTNLTAAGGQRGCQQDQKTVANGVDHLHVIPSFCWRHSYPDGLGSRQADASEFDRPLAEVTPGEFAQTASPSDFFFSAF